MAVTGKADAACRAAAGMEAAMSAERTDEQVVKERWPDAQCFRFNVGSHQFWCVSSLVGGHTLSAACYTHAEAWADAARRVELERREG